MSTLNILNLLLSVLHLAALAVCVCAFGFMLFALIRQLGADEPDWPYREIELCTFIAGFSTLAMWLSAVPDVFLIANQPARHFSPSGLVNLEFFTLSGGAILYVMHRAQERYAGADKLTQNGYDAVSFRLAVSCLLASAVMLAIQLAPDDYIPRAFTVLTPESLFQDMLIVFLLLTVMVFIFLVPVNDQWINYRFGRNHGPDSISVLSIGLDSVT